MKITKVVVARAKPPARVSDWVGWKVRLLHRASNQLVEIPAGTILTVTSSGPVKTLRGPQCESCGIAPVLTYRLNRAAFLREVEFVEFVVESEA